MKKVLLLFSIFLLLFTIRAQSTESTVIQWNNLVLNTIKITKSAPPIVSRMLFLVNSAMYDAWSAYDSIAIGTTFAGNLRRPESESTIENKNKAICYAAFVAFNDLLPAYIKNSTDLMISFGYDPNISTKDYTTPEGIGNIAGNCVIKGRHGDGSNQLGDLTNGTPYSDYTNYVPSNTPNTLNDPNLWQPLNVSNGNGGFNIQKFAVPHWGTVKTFADDVWPTISDIPYRYPSDGFTAQNEEILSIYQNLDDRKKMISEYWAGGPGSVTPPGIWIQYAQYISKRDSHNLDKDVKLFFIINAAMFDASVVCWGMKRYFNSVRPITAIRFQYKGKLIKSWAGPGLGIQEMSGENWIPYQELNFVTPPFPDFYSGHSTFSGAAAEVLKRFTGSDSLNYQVTIRAGSSTIEPGVTPSQDIVLSYNTFTDAAQDAGISRLYGGIHFRLANLNGLTSGATIGQNVFTRAMSLINGQQVSVRSTPINKSSASSFSLFHVFFFQITTLLLLCF